MMRLIPSLLLLGVLCCAQHVASISVKSHSGYQPSSYGNEDDTLLANQKQRRLQPNHQLRDESVDNYLTLVMENFAIAMKTGIPILGIPVMDPFNISKLEIPPINTSVLKVKANASDISVSGTSSYTPTYVHVDFDTEVMFLDLHFLGIRVDGDYWCDGLLMFILPMFGDGFFYIDVTSANSSGSGGVYVTRDDHLQISELTLTLSFDKLDIYFDNLLGGGSFGEEMNKAINDLASAIVVQILPLLNTSVLPALVSYVNAALMQYTIAEIIDGILPGTLEP